jgi:hypothetical protein
MNDEETVMNRSISVDESPITQQSESDHAVRRLLFWAMILVVGAIVGTVLKLDASMTLDQRMNLFNQQSVVFP